MNKQKKKIGVLLFEKKEEQSKTDINAHRFIEEIEKLGFEPEIFYNEFFSVFFERDRLEIFYNNKKLNPKEFLFFLPRYNLTNNDSYHNFTIVRFLNTLGVKTFNSPEPACLAKNKRDSLLKLALDGLSIVPTSINFSQFFLDQQLRKYKDKRIVVKSNSSALGYGVSVLDSPISFISFMEFIGSIVLPANILIQPFISSNNEDYRILVIGNKVVASMERKANGIEFRANISKGGKGEKIKPTKKMADLAIKASKVLGLDYAGVDIIKDKNGKLMIVEVNSNPGLEIEKITGINVVKEIIKYCIKKTKQ